MMNKHNAVWLAQMLTEDLPDFGEPAYDRSFDPNTNVITVEHKNRRDRLNELSDCLLAIKGATPWEQEALACAAGMINDLADWITDSGMRDERKVEEIENEH